MSEKWIVIPKWEEFQHRDAARANVPTWIKDFTQQLSKDEYLGLTWQQRGLLHDLRLEYARSKRQLSASTTSLSRRLGQPVRASQIEALNRAGFIELHASKPASTNTSMVAGAEEKRLEDKDLALKGPTSNGKTNGAGHDFAKNVVTQSKREHRPYDPPSDSLATLTRLINNGVIADEHDLDVELRSGEHRVTDEEREQLAAMLQERVA